MSNLKRNLALGNVESACNFLDGIMTQSYSFGIIDETISRIDKKLEDLCKELQSLTTILENKNER